MSKALDELNKAIWESMPREQRIKQVCHQMALRASIAAEAAITASRLRLDDWNKQLNNEL